MDKNLLFGVAGLSLIVAACSETEPSATEADAAASVQTVFTFAKAGPGILSDGFDAALDLETFNDRCDVAVERLQGEYDGFVALEEPYTIDTVIKPYDTMGMGPGEGGSWFYFMGLVHPDADMRDAANTCYERFVEIGSKVNLDGDVYSRIKAVDLSGADPVLKAYVEDEIRSFENSGVHKDEATRTKIRDLIQKSVATGREFERNIREDVRYVEMSDVSVLDGLPEDFIASHQPDEDGVLRVSTNYPDLFPVMKYAHNDDLRRRMRLAYGNQAYPVNEAVLRTLLETRYELAQVLDYENYAAMTMEDRMISTVKNAEDFIDEISAIVKPPAEIEKARMLKRYQQIDPDAQKVMPWQRSYINNIIRVEEYQVNAAEIRQYFQYDLVRDGVFALVEDLFELDIRAWETSVWDESVETFEVYDGDALIGRFYLDMHPRDGKYQHAAAMTLRPGVIGMQIPISALMCNFPGGDGTAGLMEHSQVETFLHEFGHLVHNMLSGTQEWAGVAGMSMEHDFVEAPSQMLEEWIWDYETVSKFARNDAGEVIPVELFDKMKAARNYGQAMSTAGQTQLGATSLNYYNGNPDNLDFEKLDRELQLKYSVFDYTEGTHFYTRFGHLNGYSSNYYTYQWSLGIAADMFTEFEKNGLRDKATARRYRELVLGAAGSKPAAEFIADFLGRPWSLDAYKAQLEAAATSSGVPATE